MELLRRMAVLIVVICVMLMLAGCSFLKGLFKNSVVDGPGMVYEGYLLDQALERRWDSENFDFKLIIEGKQFALYHHDVMIVDFSKGSFSHGFNGGELTGRQDLSADFPQFYENGEEFADLKAFWYEDESVHMVLTYPDGREEEIVFYEEIHILDGPGMVYDGMAMDEALAGTWSSEDGRYVIVNQPERSSVSLDGKEIRVIEHNNLFYHHFSAAVDDLNEQNRIEMYFGPLFTDDDGNVLLMINEVWYQAGHIYLKVTPPEGEPEEVVLSLQEAE